MGKIVDKRYWIQVLLLSAVTFLCVAPKTYKTGLLMVSRTYAHAAERINTGISPYEKPVHDTQWLATDWYKYSPFLALAYTVMTWLPNTVHALLWVWINVLFFWMGVSAWVRLDRKTSPWIWFAILAMSVELNISLVHQQINGLLSGMIMLGMAAYAGKQFGWAGTWLALATNFKIIPAPLLGALGLQMRRKYLFAAILTLTVVTVIPVFFIGFDTTVRYHIDWMNLLLNDVHSQGIADIESLMQRLGAPTVGAVLRWSVLFVTAALMITPLVRGEDPDWEIWTALALLGVTLWNPRTESPTFVLVAPTYLFFMRRTLGAGTMHRLGQAFMVLVLFLITFSFSDVWPKSIWDPGNPVCAAKTIGTLMLFLVSAKLSLNTLFSSEKREPHAQTTRRLATETP